MKNDSQFINLNSKDSTRNNGTFNSDVTFPIKQILKDDPTIIYSQINLYTCSIPISFYIINEYNALLTYTTGGVQSHIGVPYGNYTINSLSSVLQTLFSANGISISITLNKITGILTFVSTVAIRFIFIGFTILTVLGFNTTTLSSTTLVGTQPANVLGIKKLKLFSSALATSSFSSSNYGTRSLLKTLCVNDSPFGVLLFQSSGELSPLLITKSITSIDLQIRDEEDNLINFNNIDWNITLQLNSFRYLAEPDKSPNFEELAKNNRTVDALPDDELIGTQDDELIGTQKDELIGTQEDIGTGDNSLDVLLYNQKLQREGLIQ